MHHGSSSAGGRYNRTSLRRHDHGEKREPWNYRGARKRTTKTRARVVQYRFEAGHWLRVD